MKKIIVMGDSHSQLFDNNPVLNRGIWSDREMDIFDVRWLGPFTYWRLSRDHEEFIDLNKDILYTPHIGMTSTTKINIDNDVMISLGEIDVRCNIGKQSDPKSNIDQICISLDKYLSKYKNYKIHLISIIPPIRVADCVSPNNYFPFIGTDNERSENTLYFNLKLKDICEKNKFGYFDIHSLYKDSDNLLDLKKSDKIVHGIKINELEIYIKNYFGI